MGSFRSDRTFANLRSDGEGADELTFVIGLLITFAEGCIVNSSLAYAFVLDAMGSDDEPWASLALSNHPLLSVLKWIVLEKS